MNELFKTKVGFTVGLLAAAFTIEPVIDKNSDIGFVVFGAKITLQHAYHLLMSCLGLSVYFNSIQFATDKHFPLLDKISNGAYALALAIPPIYAAFALMNIILANLSHIGVNVSPIASSLISGVLTGLMATFLYQFLDKSLRLKFDNKRETSVD